MALADLAASRPGVGRGLVPAVVMAAGLSWIGGTYAWPGPQWLGQIAVTVVHVVPVAVAVLAVRAIVMGRRAAAGRVALTVLASVVKVVTVVAAVWASTHTGGFGPHGLADWVPIAMVNAGGGLWLRTMIFRRNDAVTALP